MFCYTEKMNKRRIFIAINLPENVKKELSSFQTKWQALPIRWTKKENLHITLDFIGNINDDELLEVIKKTKNKLAEVFPFSVNLNNICYGPLDKLPPRMIWAIGEKIENMDLKPHITLGRIRQWEWRRMDPEEMPEINEDISLVFNVDSIEIMQSQLNPKGPKYTIIESIKLK